MKKLIPFLILAAGLTGAGDIWAQEMKTYHPNGKIRMELNDSGMKTYYEDGTVQTDFPFKDGVPTGTGKSYYPNGQVKREDNFLNRRYKIYDENGKVTKEGDMPMGPKAPPPAPKKK